MSYQNPIGNGCSLEDCYTNLFALADLTHLHFRKYTYPSVARQIDPLDDPVFTSYAQCQRQGILCAWKRVPRENSNPSQPHELQNFSRELWVFWYQSNGQSEPKNLRPSVSSQLQELDSGCWTSSIDYECRTVLFRAIHNVIERCLVSKGFVRLGKWFVQPLNRSSESRRQFTIRLSFFLHGESTVCASVDVRQHPSVLRLRSEHFKSAEQTGNKIPVLLAPYGLAGELTGRSYKEDEPSTRQLLERWRQFYNLCYDEIPMGDCVPPPSVAHASSDELPLPKFVEVLVSGYRMRYPSCFVLLLSENEPEQMKQQSEWTFAVKTLGSHGLHRVVCDLCDPVDSKPCTCNKESSSLNLPQRSVVMSSRTQRLRSSSRYHHRVKEKSCGDSLVNQQCNRIGALLPLINNASQQLSSVQSTLGHSSVSAATVSTSAGSAGVSAAPTTEPIMPTLSPQAPINRDEVEEDEPQQLLPPWESSPVQEEDIAVAQDSPAVPVDSQVETTAPESLVWLPENIPVEEPPQPASSPPLASFPEPVVRVESSAASSWCDDVRQQQRGIKRPLLTSPLHACLEDSSTSSITTSTSIVQSWYCQPDAKMAKVEGESILTCDINDHRVMEQQSLRAAAMNEVDPYDFTENETRSPAISTGLSPWKTKPPPPAAAVAAAATAVAKPCSPVVKENDLVKNDSVSVIGGSLTNENDIRLTADDINVINLFEDDDDEDIDAGNGVQVAIGSSMASSSGSGVYSAADLTKIYPTPPSHDTNHESDAAQASPTESLHCSDTAVSPVAPASLEPCSATEASTMDPCEPGSTENSVDMEWNFVRPSSAHFVFGDKFAACNISEKLSHKQPVFDHRRHFFQFWSLLPGRTSNAAQQLQGPPSVPPGVIRQPFTPSTAPVTPQNVLTPGSYHNVSSVDMATPRTPGSVGAASCYEVSAPSRTTPHTPQQPIDYFGSPPASNASSLLNRTFSSTTSSNSPEPLSEAHSLFVNLLLNDSMMNLFRDHNFDSCNICVCQGNAKGSEVGLYLSDPALKNAGFQATYGSCTCGFSAVMNKKLVMHAGVFYEDEIDITGVKEDRPYKPVSKENSSLPHELLETLLQQTAGFTLGCLAVHSSLELLRVARNTDVIREDEVEFKDSCELARSVLDQARGILCRDQPSNVKLEEGSSTLDPFHAWCFSKSLARVPENSGDVVRLLRSLRPWLQDALCDKRLEAYYQVTGPMTWKDFHKQAGRGNEETCEPQPLPRLSVGHERDGLMVSPYALSHWELLNLEPYSRPKDLIYVVLTPTSVPDDTAQEFEAYPELQTFLQELSYTYEECRLGRCESLSGQGIYRGLLRLSRLEDLADDYPNNDLEWFQHIPGDVGRELRLYARVCYRRLANLLSEQSLEKLMANKEKERVSTADNSRGCNTGQMFSSRVTAGSSNLDQKPATPDPSSLFSSMSPGSVPTPSSCIEEEDTTGISSTTTGNNTSGPVNANRDVFLVVYLLDCMSFNLDLNETHRVILLGLLRSANILLNALPESLKHRVSVQLLPMDQVMKIVTEQSQPRSAILKSVAFALYNSAWRQVPCSVGIRGRSMTGFGPTSDKERILATLPAKDLEQRQYSPAYSLTPHHDYRQLRDAKMEHLDSSRVIFCAYCLSEDQAWLLATVTDERGELCERTLINLRIPERHRRRKASARRIGLQKLWDFLQGVLASEPTIRGRLVIQRLGRLGHSELKGWDSLLSRGNLQKQPGLGIQSASLVALEIQPSFRVLADQVRLEERASSQVPLSTPNDASVTHILVFPTSAMASKGGDNPGDVGLDVPGLEMEQFLSGPSEFDPLIENFSDDMLKNLDLAFGPFDDVGDQVVESLGNAGAGLAVGVSGLGSGLHGSSSDLQNQPDGLSGDPQDDSMSSLMQQPLALGYYLSTAPTGPLPAWFYSSCPRVQEASKDSPVCFKASLHVHTACVGGQDPNGLGGPPTSDRHAGHPLDSTRTTDVLRYVLETYNALSWLTFDPAWTERRSCLPVHMLNLIQLYHALDAFL